MSKLARTGGCKPTLEPLPCSPEHQIHREKCRISRLGRKSPHVAHRSSKNAKLIDRVRALLLDGPHPFKDLHDAMGCDREQARKIMDHLRKRKQIIRDQGRWRLQELVTA